MPSFTTSVWFKNWVIREDVNTETACVDLARSKNRSRYLNSTRIIWIPASWHLCVEALCVFFNLCPHLSVNHTT